MILSMTTSSIWWACKWQAATEQVCIKYESRSLLVTYFNEFTTTLVSIFPLYVSSKCVPVQMTGTVIEIWIIEQIWCFQSGSQIWRSNSEGANEIAYNSFLSNNAFVMRSEKWSKICLFVFWRPIFELKIQVYLEITRTKFINICLSLVLSKGTELWNQDRNASNRGICKTRCGSI